MTSIGILGGGFSGTMTAIQLIKQTEKPIEISIIDQQSNFLKGIAYNSYSNTHILNVPAAKMSTFPDVPEHFLNWVLTQSDYVNKNKELLGAAFLPRNVYGNYLTHLWDEAVIEAQQKAIVLVHIDAEVEDLEITETLVQITLTNGKKSTF